MPRPIVALAVTLLVELLLATWALSAAAQPEGSSEASPIQDAGMAAESADDEGDAGGGSRRALNEAIAALAAKPANRDAARHAFERATGATDDLGAVAEAYFRLGFLEEEDGAFERALADQGACMAKAPYSNWARSARQRIHWITARSEGGFEPLARLQRVRRNPALGSDPAAIEALARDADAFPPGRVRAESRMFVAEAWLTRMNRPGDAILEFRKVADDPSSDATDASLAHRGLLQAFLSVGRLDDAASQVRSVPASNPELSAQVHRLVLRRALRRTAVAELVMFALLVVVGLGRAHARRGAVGALGPRRALERVGRALLSGVTMVAAMFLLLDAAGPKCLEVLGL